MQDGALDQVFPAAVFSRPKVRCPSRRWSFRLVRLVTRASHGRRRWFGVYQVGFLLERLVQMPLIAALRIKSVFDSAMWPL